MRSKNRYEWYKYVVIKKQYEHFIVTHKHVMKKKIIKEAFVHILYLSNIKK